MNLNYLENIIIPQRNKEINDGKNLLTSNPIYVVLEPVEHLIDGHHNSFTLPETLSGKEQEYGYIDLSLYDDREFKTDDTGMKEPSEVIRFWTDRFVAFFLTRKGAEDYLEYQSHNLLDAYVYVFNAGYRNVEMNNILE